MHVFNTSGTTVEKEVYFHQNARNDTVALTNATGETVFLAEYTTYGVVFEINEEGGLDEFTDFEEAPYLFQGRRVDSETSLMYFRNRYYNQQTGRWLQRDPKGYIDSLGLYEAFGGNPYFYSDPLGLEYIIYKNNKSFNEGNFVANAFNNILGKKYVDISADPVFKKKTIWWGWIPINSKKEMVHWKLNYKIKDKIPQELKKAFELFEDGASSKNRYKITLVESEKHGLSGIENGKAHAYIWGWSESLWENNGYVVFDRENNSSCDIPLPIALWHEVFGHLVRGSFHSVLTKKDSALIKENIGRKAWNFNNPNLSLGMRDIANYYSQEIRISPLDSKKRKKIFSKGMPFSTEASFLNRDKNQDK